MAYRYGNPLQKHPSYSHRRGKRQRERESERDRLERKQKKGLEINSQKLSAKEKDDGREKKRGGFGKEAGI